jgi:hypothetical protein
MAAATPADRIWRAARRCQIRSGRGGGGRTMLGSLPARPGNPFINSGGNCMAILTSLEDMVRAIAGSVMNAQHMVEKAQLANVASFFDDLHRPSMLELELPAIHSSAEPDSHYLYRVPVISLVPHSSLIIGEAEIELDVELGAFEEHERQGVHEGIMDQLGRAAPAGKKAGLMVNPGTGGIAGKSGNAAHIKLKLVATDKSEGLARLLNDAVKSQGPAAVRAPGRPA